MAQLRKSALVAQLLTLLVSVLACSILSCKAEGSFNLDDYVPASPRVVVNADGGIISVWDLYRGDVNGTFAVFSLELKENGLQFPGHLDTDVLGLVTAGSAKWGIVLTNGRSVETRTLQAGDAFFIPREAVYWFYNDGSEPFTVVAFGDTSASLRPGSIQRLDILGDSGVLYSFSLDVLAAALYVDQSDAAKLIYSQHERSLVKLHKPLASISSPRSSIRYDADFQVPLASSDPDVDVPEGGRIWNLAASLDRYPILQTISLSGVLGHQEKGSIYGPGWAPTANTVFYVIRGSARYQLSSPTTSNLILDLEITEGQIVLIPRQFGFAFVAGHDGLDWFSVADTSIPTTAFLAGKWSQYNGIPKEILEAALDVEDDVLLDKVFGGRNNSFIILPADEPKDDKKGPAYTSL